MLAAALLLLPTVGQGSDRAYGDLFASSVAGIGDIDRDGHADVLIALGYWSNPPPNDPSACVFSGRTGKLLLAVGAGLEVNRFDKRSVCGTGDLDDDETPDFALVAWRPEQERGAYWVVAYSGKDGRVIHSIRLAGERRIFGVSICSTDDCDGDAVPDIGVGMMDAYAQDPAGRVRLISGKSGLLIAEAKEDDCVWRWWGDIAAIGDSDTDGVPDISVPSVEMGSEKRTSGRARISLLSGPALRLSRRLEIPGDRSWTPSCTAGGDLDQDGRADLLASGGRGGATFGTVLSGLDGSVLLRFQNRLCSAKGIDLCSLGDVDGDGRRDFVLSEFDMDSRCTGVSIFSGRNGDRLVQMPQSHDWATPDYLGYCVAPAGDVNADGFPDLPVGTANPYGGYPGHAEVYSGRDGTLLHRWSRRDLVRSAGAEPK